MRVNALVFGIIFVFCVGADLVYWFTSKDPTGTACLALTAGLALLIGFYLFVTSQRFVHDPQDDANADISDGAGELGHFSPSSWWPIAIAAGTCLFVYGFIFGLWLLFIGIAIMVGCVVGLLFENLHDATPPAAAQHH